MLLAKNPPTIAVALLLLGIITPTSATFAQAEESKSILVFRHHPGIGDNLKARVHDANLILRQLRKSQLSYSYQGGLGSGYELTITPENVAAWKALIQDLHDKKKLRHYRPYEVDENGFGIRPPHDR